MGKHKTQRTEELRQVVAELNSETLEICQANGYSKRVIDGIVYPVRPVDLGDRTLLKGTEKGIEPPLSIEKETPFLRGGGVKGRVASVGYKYYPIPEILISINIRERT
ncbi:hypothetical protein LCGC14_1108270 [marine sediment metagenome]|uniref:Uncharacterized protein n=1 Tax=marine sediment metagenome TaxID=412755 RepID=A0A0F9MC92_9ZZZZ